MKSAVPSFGRPATNGAGPTLGLERYLGSGGLNAALARHADEAFDELDVQQRNIAELVFKRLTDFGDDGRQTRRPCPLSELTAIANSTDNEVRDVISHFDSRGRSFLHISVDDVVDISHESLIRQWPRLSEWCREEAVSSASYARLADAAERDAALLRNPDLSVATQWSEDASPTPAWAERYDGDFAAAIAYLNASQAAESRRRKRAIAAAVALVLLAVAFGLLALWATAKRSEAEEAKGEAERQAEIAEQAQAIAVEEAARARLAEGEAEQARENAEVDAQRAEEAEESAETAAAKALESKDEANRARDRARAEGLAAQSQAVRFQNPALALRLALEADATSPDARSSSLTALVESRIAFAEQQIQPVGPPIQADEVVNAVQFILDGSLLASGGRSGEVRFWDPATNQQADVMATVGSAPIRSLAFSEPQGLLAVGDSSGSIGLWSLDDTEVREFATHGDAAAVTALTFGEQGQLFSGGLDGVIRSWSLDTGEALVPARDLERSDTNELPYQLRSLVHVEDGVLAAAWANGDFRIIFPAETERDSLLFAPPDESFGTGDRVALAFDGEDRLATATGQRIQLWELDESLVPQDITPGHLGTLGEKVSTLAFASDGSLVISSEAGEVLVSRRASSDIERLPESSGGSRVGALSASPSGLLAAGSQDGVVRLTDLDSAHGLDMVKDDYLRMHGLDVNQKTGQIATLGDGNGIENPENDGVWLWNEQVESERNTSPTLVVRELEFSPDGDEIAYLERLDPADEANPDDNREGVFWIRDLASGTTRSVRFDGIGDRDTNDAGRKTAAADGLAFGSNGLVALVWNDYSARVWDTTETDLGDAISIGDHNRQIEDLAFNPDASLLATADRDGIVKVWTTVDGSLVEELDTEGEAWPRAIEFSPDGAHLVAVTMDGRILRWSVDNLGSEPERMRSREGIVDVDFSPDGLLIATIAGNGTVRLWDLDTGQQVAEPLRASAQSNTVAFSADGSSLLATGRDGLTVFQDVLSTEAACELAAEYVRDVQIEQFLGESSEIRGCQFE